jgi:hypothetical protein
MVHATVQPASILQMLRLSLLPSYHFHMPLEYFWSEVFAVIGVVARSSFWKKMVAHFPPRVIISADHMFRDPYDFMLYSRVRR